MEPVMRKPAIAAIFTAFTLASFAQQPQQCVNPEVLNGLLLLGRNELRMEVTRGSTGFLGDFRAPTGFTLIGTGVRDGTTAVAYKTSLASDKAYAAMIAALGAGGWAIEPSPGAGAGFNVAGGMKEGTLCRNGQRRVVLATESAGTTYVGVHVYQNQRARDCNAPDPAMNIRPGMDAPRFQFPAGTSLPQGGFGGGGGSNTNYTTTSRIISPEQPARLVEHLASQMESQGWRPDSTWSGAGSAGSTWRKTIDGQPSSGTIYIVRTSEGTYDVNFTRISAQ